jgi:hypothetical protein
MKNKLLVCTFSGGRTSAFMGIFLKNYPKYKDFDKVFIFANTGKEREETLQFIDRCDKHFGLNIVWLEADINKEKGVGTSFKVVSYETAARNGQPFKSMLEKYPMPNTFASNCTRELKQSPIKKYVQTLGYDEVFTAMGIRYDERHRVSMSAERDKIIYPLINDIKVDAKFVRNWWRKQPFDLELKDYEGNCDLCFKKSIRKKLTIIKENPSIADWWLEMESRFGTEKIPRFDLRSNISIQELIEMAKQPFKSVKDVFELNKQQGSLFDDFLDYETDCFCKKI